MSTVELPVRRPLDEHDWNRLNHELAGARPEEILALALDEFAPGRIALVSAFGPTSLVLIDMLHGMGRDVPVVFVDTLHHFPETLELVERARQRYDLDLRVYRPAESREEFEARYGPRLWERDLELYQKVAKVEPFRAATANLDAWITGRRREQSSTRAELPLFELGDRIRINPLAQWNRSEVWHYLLDRGVPYNPLHDQGYASIGDEPLTTPVGDGEHERAGRWRGRGITECGIHLQ